MLRAKQRQKANEEKVKDVLALIDKGFSVTDACKKSKISKPTFYHWKRIFVGESIVMPSATQVKIYTKRLKTSLALDFEIFLTLKECHHLIAKIFDDSIEKKDNLEYSEESYIELTHHTFR